MLAAWHHHQWLHQAKRACKLRTYTSTCHSSHGSLVSTTTPIEYTTLEQPVKMEVEIKKSRFIVTAWPVQSAKQAMSLIKQHSNPSASHNCYAYRIRQEYRSSDDGEPGGTAGRPILSAIEGEDLQGVAVLVTRHFGGIKLGAGGLVRAYGGAARDCLRAAPRAVVRARAELMMTCPYEVLGTVYNLLDKYGCERLGETYDETSGDLIIKVSIDAGEVSQVISAVSEATAGRVVPQLYVPCDDENRDDDES